MLKVDFVPADTMGSNDKVKNRNSSCINTSKKGSKNKMKHSKSGSGHKRRHSNDNMTSEDPTNKCVQCPIAEEPAKKKGKRTHGDTTALEIRKTQSDGNTMTGKSSQDTCSRRKSRRNRKNGKLNVFQARKCINAYVT